MLKTTLFENSENMKSGKQTVEMPKAFEKISSNTENSSLRKKFINKLDYKTISKLGQFAGTNSEFKFSCRIEKFKIRVYGNKVVELNRVLNQELAEPKRGVDESV